ncbi:MAG: energy-coupling factor ABC transporter ATP-binding protein [Gemmatimonadota bacterium]
MTALAFTHVDFTYPGAGHAVLAGITFAVAPGETVGLFGPNGAGKTTITRLAMALLHPTAGEVVAAGMSTRGRHPEDMAARAGYVFQQPEMQLFARTVREEVAFGPRQQGWDAHRIAQRTAEVLAELHLSADADQHPYDLPLARRRLVALAAALITEPALLILDEPTAALDRESRRIVERVVRRHAERGGAVVAVTHDLPFATECLDRALVLCEGKLLYDGALTAALGPSGLLPDPPHVTLMRRLGLTPASLRRHDIAFALGEHLR